MRKIVVSLLLVFIIIAIGGIIYIGIIDREERVIDRSGETIPGGRYGNYTGVLCRDTYCVIRGRYYGSGDAISYSICQECNVRMRFPTTATDELCAECSSRLSRCRACGENIRRR